MSDWNFLIDEADIASVLPDEFAHYRQPIRGALAVFLEALPAADQMEVLADQASLPPNATASERLALLARGCPALHKLGQIVARDRRLSAELREHLQELESLSPSVPFADVQSILRRELGPLDRLGVKLAPQALAEASVAVVIAFQYDPVPSGNGLRDGVFKILKPGIEERLDRELGLLERVGSYLDQTCAEFHLPQLDYQDAFEQVRERLRQEIRLDLEQRNLALARVFYKDEPRVQVPLPIPELSTPRVTAMERVTGVKVTDHRIGSESEQRRLAALVVSALIARPIFSQEGHALFHGDPHAGNLFLTDDGRLALLDWSLAGMLSERDRAAVVQVMLGAVTLDAEHVVSTLAGLAERQNVDRPALQAVVRERIRRIRRGEFPGFTWLLGLLDEAVEKARLRVGADLMMFRKTLHTLEGVLSDVGGGNKLVHAELQKEFLQQFAREWPFRWLSPPTSHDFATRLSNADLIQLIASLPWTATRLWLDQGLDLLEPLRGKSG
jgi:ubiquinone biosynthesis protein